jgi:hypothetical protein
MLARASNDFSAPTRKRICRSSKLCVRTHALRLREQTLRADLHSITDQANDRARPSSASREPSKRSSLSPAWCR